MSLFADYTKERLGYNTIESEDGFITYTFLDNGICLAGDLYVKPESRRKGVGSKLGDLLADVAVQHGCKWMACKVFIDTLNATEALKAHLAYGFKLHALDPTYITLIKEIGE